MAYRWLIFDADGTLFDFDRAEAAALVETFDAFGIAFEPGYADVYRQINRVIWRELEQGAITATALRTERFRRLFDALGMAVDPGEFSVRYLAHLSQRGDLIDGAEEMVRTLSDRYRLLILTNGLSEVQRSRLAHSGLAGAFEDIVISDEVGAAKPDGRIFDVALARMGMPPKPEVLIIGDSLSSDIAGGAAYGIDTCWFNPSGQPRPAGATIRYEIAALTDLVTSLAVLPGGWTMRHPTVEDAPAVLALFVACDMAEYGEPDSDLESLLDDWQSIDLAQDAWLIEDPSGLAIGYLGMMPRTDDFSLELYVHPACSEAGLQAVLLAHCETRVQKRLAPGASTALGAFMPSVADVEPRVLRARGYTIDQYYFRMQIDLENEPEIPPSWPAGCRLVPFIPERDARRVYAFVMEAFQWPGYTPPSFEQWRHRMMETEGYCPDLWFLLADDTGALVATALCANYEFYGWVRNLAVAKARRGQGTGSALLQHVFREFYRRGHTRISLGVDGNNPDAYRFYERLGMRQVRQFAHYTKQIAGSPER